MFIYHIKACHTTQTPNFLCTLPPHLSAHHRSWCRQSPQQIYTHNLTHLDSLSHLTSCHQLASTWFMGEHRVSSMYHHLWHSASAGNLLFGLRDWHCYRWLADRLLLCWILRLMLLVFCCKELVMRSSIL